MIRIERPPAPPIFRSRDWARERNRAKKFFGKTEAARSQHHFEFKFPRRAELREEVTALFFGKCAMCETRYSTGSPIDVELFRPRSGAIGKDGTLSPKHYWWLAYEWSNLYPVCANCNQSKGSRFPVEGKRAPIGAGQTALRKEKPLLLDPCHDEPELYLVFVEDGTVASSWERGRKTIETFNLNRKSLVKARIMHANFLALQWQGVTETLTERETSADEINRSVQVLRGYLTSHNEYVGLARCCLQQWSIEFCKEHRRFVPFFEDFLTLRTTLTPEVSLAARRKKVEFLLRSPMAKAARPKTLTTEISKTVKEFQAHAAAQSSYSLAVKSEREKFFAQTRYIRSIEIKNFKVIKHIKLTFTDTPDAGSWLLILGENATGKSSVLQAVALALMGEKERKRLGLNDGSRLATYPKNDGDVVEGFVEIQLTGGGDPIRLDFSSDSPTIATNTPDPKVLLLGYSATRLLPLEKSRLTKGSEFSKTDNLFNPFLALTKASTWLHSLEQPQPFNDVVASLKRLMILKETDHFDKADGDRIQLTAFGGRTVYLEDLSAGYQSVLALATDIMSVLLHIWGSVQVAEGIVLIDEIDAHLHPRWKMQIVERLRATFPRVQFLVTSHEPLTLRGLCQGEIAVMIRRRMGRVETITEDLPNPKGLRVDQILTSEFFGMNSTLSPELEIAFNTYYSLLARRDRTLKQEARVNELKIQLDQLRLMGDTPRERMMYEVIDEFLALKAKRPKDADKLDQQTRRKLLQMWEEI